MNHAGDGVSELGFFVTNAVAADHGASGFDHLGEAARENALQNCEISFLGKADESERGKRLAAHGVNVAQGIGGCDLSEGVRIVDDGREEIDGLHQSLIGGDEIHSGVVGVIEADQNVGVVLPG